MNSKELFECSPLLQAIYSQMDRGGPSQRLVVWPKNPSISSPEDISYVQTAHDTGTFLLDPNEIPNLESQVAVLEKNRILENQGDHRVKMITVQLSDLAKLNADLSINRDVIHSLEEFQTIRELWGQFQADPMKGFEWNLSWWKSFQESGDLNLMTFERDGEVVGIAPLYVDRWFIFKRLRFLASGNVCSDYIDIICDPQHYELCVHSLAEYIEAMDFDIVELECTQDDRLGRSLKRVLDQKFRYDHREVEPTWRLDLPDTWKGFLKGCKNSLRRKINKAIRRIDSGEVSITSTAQGLDVNLAFETLKKLHTKRFNSMDKPGVFADDRFTEFLRSSATEFCRQGKGEIVVASIDGQPFAAQLYFESQEGFQFYQGGNLPEMMNLEPGHLLFAWMVRRAIQRGDKVFDFLRGNEPYKKFWGASPHAQYKMRMISKRMFPTIVSKMIKFGRKLCGRSDD